MACLALLKKASLVGAFFMLGIQTGAAWAFCPAPSGLSTAKVQRVVDGDTLRLSDGRSVRLLGLNSPELGRQGRSAEPFAEAARKRLQALVDAGRGRVQLQPGVQSKDHYGRTLAHAYDPQGRNLEAQLLSEGLGYWVAVAPNLALERCHEAAERTAREARLGVWQRPVIQSPKQLNRGGFNLIQGRVERVERNRGGVWLEMGDSVVLHIAARMMPNFDASALQDLEGRQIEARGWVVDRAKRGGLREGQARWMLPLTAQGMLQVRP